MYNDHLLKALPTFPELSKTAIAIFCCFAFFLCLVYGAFAPSPKRSASLRCWVITANVRIYDWVIQPRTGYLPADAMALASAGQGTDTGHRFQCANACRKCLALHMAGRASYHHQSSIRKLSGDRVHPDIMLLTLALQPLGGLSVQEEPVMPVVVRR